MAEKKRIGLDPSGLEGEKIVGCTQGKRKRGDEPKKFRPELKRGKEIDFPFRKT